MGSISSILFNIPGRTSSAATLIDGYPMALQGRAKTAIACSATASALGSTFGIVVLILLIPFMRGLILRFGPAEFLMLAVWGLTTLAVFTRESLVKGLAAAGLGLLFAFVGFDPRTAEARFTMETMYLRNGLSTVPVFLGLFAVSEIIALMARNRATISGVTRTQALSGSVREGVAAVFQNFGLFLRSSAIGTVIGMIPGVGASVASFVAYGHALQTTRGGRFGDGDIRGVLAPESAVDAKDGGALVPTLAFGIPGGTGTAMLLAAFVVHGMTPGREMMTTQLSLVFVLIWSLFVSNLLTSLLGLSMVRPLAHLTVVRTTLLIPILLGLATLGAYLYRQQVEDVVVACAFGVFGYAMSIYGWPRVPLVIGVVLGPLFENNLQLTLQLQQLGRIDFWRRPIAMTLLVLCVASVLFSLKRRNGTPS
jgi:TctA family transporter